MAGTRMKFKVVNREVIAMLARLATESQVSIGKHTFTIPYAAVPGHQQGGRPGSPGNYPRMGGEKFALILDVPVKMKFYFGVTMSEDNQVQPAGKDFGEVLTSAVEGILAGAGAVLKRNALVAFNRVLVSGADVLVAKILRYTTVENANAAAEKSLIEAAAKQVAKRMDINPQYVAALAESP
jgi:hypothetical protein